MLCSTTGEANANEAYAANNGHLAKADSVTKFLLLGPLTERWQDAINEMVKDSLFRTARSHLQIDPAMG